MVINETLLKNAELKAGFLEDRNIPDQYKVHNPFNPDPFGYIYCIENKTSHKKYIGSTYAIWSGIKNPGPLAQLKKRASMYLYEYNKAKKDLSDPNKKNPYLRPIIQAMVDEGFDNFVMYPIAETSRDNHKAAELYFINKFDTVAKGYNVDYITSGTYKVGAAISEAGKLARSEGVVCINPNQQKLILSDSMKLFADYMGSTKDMIKNSNRKGRPYKGWFVFYRDPAKRLEVLDKNVRGDGLAKNDQHSEKSKRFYEKLCGTVSLYIQDNFNPEYFPNFEKLPALEYKDDLK